MHESEIEFIRGILSERKIREFAEDNLRESLKSIGFSSFLIDELIACLDNFKIGAFLAEHERELEEIHSVKFFQKIVPDYFENYVLPEIPESRTIVDIGCGTGVLASLLSKNGKFEKIIGVDLNSYSEWDLFKTDKIALRIIKENEFEQFMSSEKPDTLVLTWTLHHMSYEQQEEYIKLFHNYLSKHSKVIVLEDAYSTKFNPQVGPEKHGAFMKLNQDERRRVMSFYDWVANRILARRHLVPMPFSFKTSEEWTEFFEQNGFEVVNKKYIGFPERRDINTPQSLFVASRI